MLNFAINHTKITRFLDSDYKNRTKIAQKLDFFFYRAAKKIKFVNTKKYSKLLGS